MTWREPFRNAREQHLGEFLDTLAGFGMLTWELQRNDPEHRSWVIDERGPGLRRHSLGEAERLAQHLSDSVSAQWVPVPAPAGLSEYHAVRARIAARREKIGLEPYVDGPDQSVQATIF